MRRYSLQIHSSVGVGRTIWGHIQPRSVPRCPPGHILARHRPGRPYAFLHFLTSFVVALARSLDPILLDPPRPQRAKLDIVGFGEDTAADSGTPPPCVPTFLVAAIYVSHYPRSPQLLPRPCSCSLLSRPQLSRYQTHDALCPTQRCELCDELRRCYDLRAAVGHLCTCSERPRSARILECVVHA